jgi:hypothetical protein
MWPFTILWRRQDLTDEAKSLALVEIRTEQLTSVDHREKDRADANEKFPQWLDVAGSCTRG